VEGILPVQRELLLPCRGTFNKSKFTRIAACYIREYSVYKNPKKNTVQNGWVGTLKPKKGKKPKKYEEPH